MRGLTKEDSKEELEYELFKIFAIQQNWPWSRELLSHGAKREPDWIYAGLEETVAFEITRVIEPELARDRANPSGKAFWFSSNVEYVIRKKLDKKQYVSSYPIELVVCHGGEAAITDDYVVPILEIEIYSSSTVPFRKIWYSGQHKSYLVYSASD